MNNYVPLFPLQPGDELCFQIESNPNQRHDIPQDLQVLHHHSSHHHHSSNFLPQYDTHQIPTTNSNSNSNNNSNKGPGKGRVKGKGRRPQSVPMDNDDVSREDINITHRKKLIHRDIERQRRQEMASLYASLRSLLPIEFIKGKRSISDHMNESVNYINHLQRKIKELGDKRDELKRLSNLGSFASTSGELIEYNCSSPSLVLVRPFLGGIEIVFSTGSGLLSDQDLTLSGVLQLLLEEGISVVNCVSTKVNERLFHTVQTQVDDPSCLNLTELQQKLSLLAPSSL